ncbi:hypothetical protein [Spirillospora sp. NPDC029432]|uniref:hypothetical protein n=1 Tax=Spirillospora sp. NPDC029432 TaxID=3154599 RepID=UPI0034525537
MAPPQFSMYSPGPGPDDGTSVEPLFGAGRERDPGFAASVRDGSVIGQLRRLVLVLVAAPVLILAITPLIVRGEAHAGAVPWCCLALAAVAAAVAAAGPRTPPPMSPGRAPRAAAAESLGHFRQALMVRYALAEGVILLGLVLAIAFRSELVYLAGFVLGQPLLLWLTLPTGGRIESVRRRLESRGAESHLWAALLASAPRPDRSAYTVPREGPAAGAGQDPGPDADGVAKP